MSSGIQYKNGVLLYKVVPCSFYLFRLPHLAFMNIINAMTATEQCMTSLCSRRALSTIKTLRRRSEKIRIIASDRFVTIIRTGQQLPSQFANSSKPNESVIINGLSVFSVYSKDGAPVITRWAKRTLGAMELIEHVCSLFNEQVDTMVIEKNTDNLITLDCISLTVQERKFTWAELNRFIKHWMNGGSVRLRMLLVAVGAKREYNHREMFDGLNARRNVERKMIVSYRQKEYQFAHFFEVDSNGGLTAGFRFDSVAGLVRFGVWPSDTGKIIDLRLY
uniref:FBA_2 domain-containing protein n=2 Tax=Caenorhabditis tropicalis TaxID=1561998 RepID=A0A1I7V3V6_9PELO